MVIDFLECEYYYSRSNLDDILAIILRLIGVKSDYAVTAPLIADLGETSTRRPSTTLLGISPSRILRFSLVEKFETLL